MRVAVVAGPDPGHAFPALALCRRFRAAGDSPTLLTGTEWLDTARSVGVDTVELVGLDPTDSDDDSDAGEKIHRRAGRMAVLNVPVLRDIAPDLVVSDVPLPGRRSGTLLGLLRHGATKDATVGLPPRRSADDGDPRPVCTGPPVPSRA